MRDLSEETQGLRSEMQAMERYLTHISLVSSHLGEQWSRVLPRETAGVDKIWAVKAQGKDVQLPPAVELGKLLAKAKAIFAEKTNEEFTMREIRMLPYILPDKTNSMRFISFLFSCIQPRLSRRSQFRQVLYVYLNNYSRTDSWVTYVRKELYDFWKQEEKPGAIPLLKKNPYLLEEGADEGAAKKIVQNGIASFLKESEFPVSLYASDFIRKSILQAFTLSVSGEQKLKLLYEMMENLNYKGLISEIISPCILYVDEKGDRDERQKLLELILSTMGDPRGNNSGWVQVTQEAKERVFSWLVEKDFDFFFGIIEKTATVTAPGKRMWPARRQFWEKYKNEITASRIVLGVNAQNNLPNIEREMKRDLKVYDCLKKASNRETSLLVFCMRSYVFIEVSHNGSLRIFEKNHAPVDIWAQGSKVISYSPDITGAANIERISHSAGWEAKAEELIYKYCGI